MRIEPFVMERWQSTWENKVRYNLSESGVHPMTLGELLGSDDLSDTLLGYPQSNGTEELRERVSDLYPGSDIDHVVVTNGSAEANFVSILNLVEPGDDVIVMLPNYMQIWGLCRSLGANVTPWFLREQERWAPDLDELEGALTDKTKLIAICHPNNPTGALLTEEELRRVCQLAGKVGAWILADEVYQGAELGDEPAATFHGWYDRVLVTCGLSKAYGLPGLRIGWVLGPPEKIAELWSYKDYTTIGPGALSERLARLALEPAQRHQILERARGILRAQLPIVRAWVDAQGAAFRMISPQAGGIAYVHYELDVGSTTLVERLRKEKSVLLVPGDHFLMDHYVRIGYGAEPEVLEKGLALFSEVLEPYKAEVK